MFGQTIFRLRRLLTEPAASLKWRRKAVWIDLLPCSDQALETQVFDRGFNQLGRRRMRLLRSRGAGLAVDRIRCSNRVSEVPRIIRDFLKPDITATCCTKYIYIVLGLRAVARHAPGGKTVSF